MEKCQDLQNVYKKLQIYNNKKIEILWKTHQDLLKLYNNLQIYKKKLKIRH